MTYAVPFSTSLTLYNSVISKLHAGALRQTCCCTTRGPNVEHSADHIDNTVGKWKRSVCRRKVIQGIVGMLVTGMFTIREHNNEGWMMVAAEGILESEMTNKTTEILKNKRDEGERQEATMQAYMMFALGEKEGNRVLGRVVVDLYGKKAPKGVDRFLEEIRENKGVGLSVYRVVPGLSIQIGGEDVKKGGRKVLVRRKAGDVEWIGGHDKKGAVAMVDEVSGKFLVEMREGGSEYLEGKCTAIGKVVEGLDVFEMMEKMGSTGTENRPKQNIRIIESGIVRILESGIV